MIFITLGSQKFQFNRLLEKVDKLIEEKNLIEDVFAQTGYSDYKPKNYKYKEFLDRDEFSEMMKISSIVITHGGTGAIITALKNDKRVIAIPRLSSYNEHVDDHQVEITSQFKEMNLIESVNDIELLYDAIQNIYELKLNTYKSNTVNIINEIECFIMKQN